MGTTEGAREGIWEKERKSVLVVVVVVVVVVAVVVAVVVHNAGEAPIFFSCCYCMVVSCGLPLKNIFFHTSPPTPPAPPAARPMRIKSSVFMFMRPCFERVIQK